MIFWDALFSERAKAIKGSAIRELLKLVTQPDIISFGGGLPDPKLFPVEKLKECADYVLETEPEQALQYGTTEGVPALRSLLAERAKKQGINCTPENIIVVASSQQALDLVAKVLLDPGDVVYVEAPSYIGAIQAFGAFQAHMVPIAMDDEGMRVDILESRIKTLSVPGKQAKMIYTVPSFQNPTGVTMSLERRLQLLEISTKYNIPIVEDAPYHQLRFEGDPIPPIASLDSNGRVVYLETFSKILSPGLRLGWIIGPEDFVRKVVLAKQATDLCTSPLTQFIALEFTKRGYIEPHVEVLKREYKKKKDGMLNALDEFFPKEARWTKPQGGLFLWVELPKGFDTTEMLKEVLEAKVAYVSGTGFYPNGGGENCMRLNFSYSSPETNREGIRRLAEIVKKKLATIRS